MDDLSMAADTADTYTDATGRIWTREVVHRSDNEVWESPAKGRSLTIGSDGDGLPCIISAHLAPVELYEHAIEFWER